MIGDVVLVGTGAATVLVVLDSAIRTFVLPRGATVRFTRLFFRVMRTVFGIVLRPARSYESRDRMMALFAPTSLLLLPVVWLVVLFAGFACIFAAAEGAGWRDALATSGSSLLTIGIERPEGIPTTMVAFTEATIGLGLLALLIAYLPTMYLSFSRREVAVSRLAVRAGSPPTGANLLELAHQAGFLGQLDDVWVEWEVWFAELAETHTSLAALNYFRSPNPHRSWITASGAVLDGAALRYALLDVPWTPDAGLCIRSGYLALREVASYFDLPSDEHPRPDDPICITREEFDAVYDRLARAGLPVVADRAQAWRDYAGWRVNYDTVLLALAGLLMAPYAPWVSDRSPVTLPPEVRRRFERGRA